MLVLPKEEITGAAVLVKVIPAEIEVALHPLLFETFTEYVPATEAASVCCVAPLMADPFNNHWLPVADEEASVILPPEQKAEPPVVVILGIAG